MPVDPSIFDVHKEHPDVALDTLRRFTVDFLNGLADSTVSMEDLRLVVGTLTQLSTDYLAALQTSLADRAQLRSMVEELAALRLRGATTAPVSKSLLLGVVGTVTPYPVTFATPLTSSNWVPVVTLDSASISLLGSLTWQVVDKTATGCTVNVRNGALLALAQTVTVTVTAIQLT